MSKVNNIDIENNGQLLTLRVNLAEKGEVSASGKSIIVASTHGNFELPNGFVLSMNVYKPVKKKKVTIEDDE